MKQKPNQDVLSEQSFLVVFSADGTSKDILTDQGDVLQVVWKDNQNLVALLRDETLEESIVLVNIDNPDGKDEILNGGNIQWIDYKDGMLWMVTEEEIQDFDYDRNEGLQGLLNAFSELKKKQTIWSYDFENDALFEWPLEGFFPQQF